MSFWDNQTNIKWLQYVLFHGKKWINLIQLLLTPLLILPAAELHVHNCKISLSANDTFMSKWTHGCADVEHCHWNFCMLLGHSQTIVCLIYCHVFDQSLQTHSSCDLYSLLLSILETECLIGLEGVVYVCTRCDPLPHTHYWMLSFIIQGPSELQHAFSPLLCHSCFLSLQSLVASDLNKTACEVSSISCSPFRQNN